MKERRLQQLQAIERAFAASKVALPLALKMQTAELILRLTDRKKRFGLFVILGWQGKWKDYLDISDRGQDIFAGRPLDIMRIKPGKRRSLDVSLTLDFDGAILIDRHGAIVHSGAIIEGLRPRIVARKINPGHFTDLSEQFGFDTKVHTRHLSAIAASSVFRGTTVFTVSEETDAFHVFEEGRIVYHA